MLNGAVPSLLIDNVVQFIQDALDLLLLALLDFGPALELALEIVPSVDVLYESGIGSLALLIVANVDVSLVVRGVLEAEVGPVEVLQALDVLPVAFD